MLGQVMDRVASAIGGVTIGTAILFVLGLIALLAFPSYGRAETYYSMPSTPDISITGTATTEYLFDITGGGSYGPADWVGIKNDCNHPIWFSLQPGKSTDAQQFNLKLEGTQSTTMDVSRAGQSFSGPFRTYSIAASGDGANNCTFTLQLGRKVK